MGTSAFSAVNWLYVLFAALAYFGLGAIWYSALFSKKWIRWQNIDVNDPRAKEGAAATMIGSAVWMFVTSAALAVLIHHLGITQMVSAVKLGALTGIAFSAAAISVTYLYVKKPFGLHLIDGLYHVLGQIIAAVIITAGQ